jgi:cytochrome c peroxidase
MYKNINATLLALTAATAVASAFGGDDAGSARHGPALQRAEDPSGVLGVLNLNGPTRRDGPFFQSLGTNGRSCASCHVAEQGMSISAAGVRTRFELSHGRDPLFAPVDGANCPSARQGDRAAHSLLLKSGLIRIALPLPAKAQFSISVVHDPYGCAIVPDAGGGPPTVAVYRRPLPTANLVFLSTVMRQISSPISPIRRWMPR